MGRFARSMHAFDGQAAACCRVGRSVAACGYGRRVVSGGACVCLCVLFQPRLSTHAESVRDFML